MKRSRNADTEAVVKSAGKAQKSRNTKPPTFFVSYATTPTSKIFISNETTTTPPTQVDTILVRQTAPEFSYQR